MTNDEKIDQLVKLYDDLRGKYTAAQSLLRELVEELQEIVNYAEIEKAPLREIELRYIRLLIARAEKTL